MKQSKESEYVSIFHLYDKPKVEWVSFIEYGTYKRLVKTFKSQRAVEMWHNKNMDSILGEDDVMSVGYMSKNEWEKEN